MMESLYQPSVLKKLLSEHGFTLKKQFGQNFLIDGQVLHAIVEEAGSECEGAVKRAAVEIGPGVGTLTQALAEAGFDKVLAVEKDRHLLPLLKKTMQAYPQVQIVLEDALKFDFAAWVHELPSEYSVHFVANLPYYITTPLVMGLLEARVPFCNMVIMVQKEVARRMVAPPGGKEYGALSVAVQYYTEPRILLTVPSSSFLPNPSVDSAVVSMRLRPHPDAQEVDQALFFRVVRGAFQQRRKTLQNALTGEFRHLSKEFVIKWLKSTGIDGNRRGETLSIREFAALTKELQELVQQGV